MLDITKNPHVNGIDVAALGEVAEAVQAHPAKGKVGFAVTTRWTGQTRSETTVEGVTIDGVTQARRHVITADEPTGLLGSDSAPNPQELLMAALNSCIVVGYAAGASVRGIALESIEVHTKGQLDLRGFLGLSDDVPPGYPAIDYEVRIKGDGTSEQFEEIHQAVLKTSPNFFNIANAIPVNATLRVG
jgi:uncharacterized OsmC-like protein